MRRSAVASTVSSRGERAVGDGPLALVGELAEVARRRSAKRRQSASKLLRALRVDEHAVDQHREAVAGGAVERPVDGHVLVRGGDLLGDDVERPRARAGVGLGQPAAAGVAVLQAGEVLGRVAQAVGMVDAQAVDLAGGGQVERRSRASPRTPARLLHAQAGEVVDVEEAAVVDLVGGDAPEGEPVGLLLVQRVQLDACRRAASMIASAEPIGAWPPRAARAASAARRCLSSILVAPALGRFGRSAPTSCGRQVRERRRQAAQPRARHRFVEQRGRAPSRSGA